VKPAAPLPSTVLLVVVVAGWRAGTVNIVAAAAAAKSPAPPLCTVLMVVVVVAGWLAGTV
jgi:hypothetical protein